MNFYDYSDEKSKGLIESAIFNKCQVEIKKLNEKIDNIEKTNQELEEKVNILNKTLEKILKFLNMNDDDKSILSNDDSDFESLDENVNNSILDKHLNKLGKGFKYIQHETSEGKINYFRVTKIQTGSLTSGEGWTHYMRDIYVEIVNFSEGQFFCKDENGLFQIWDNIECRYVDYLSYDKNSDEDTIELNFWIKRDNNTDEKYVAPNIESFLEMLVLRKCITYYKFK